MVIHMERMVHADTSKAFVLNLGGPDGNAFALMGIVKNLLKQDPAADVDAIIQEMMSGDYENLLTVFCKHVGQYVYFTNVAEEYLDTLEEAVDGYGCSIEFED